MPPPGCDRQSRAPDDTAFAGARHPQLGWRQVVLRVDQCPSSALPDLLMMLGEVIAPGVHRADPRGDVQDPEVPERAALVPRRPRPQERCPARRPRRPGVRLFRPGPPPANSVKFVGYLAGKAFLDLSAIPRSAPKSWSTLGNADLPAAKLFWKSAQLEGTSSCRQSSAPDNPAGPHQSEDH